MIEYTVSLGNLIGIATVIIGVISLFWRLTTYHAQNAERLATLETQMDALWRWFTTRLERRQRLDDYNG